MRIKLNKHKFIILAVFLIVGVSIAVWAITFDYNHTAKNTESQKEPRNESKAANIVPVATNHSNTILLLVFAGLIGLIGIRRQGEKLENLKKVKRPEREAHKNFSYKRRRWSEKRPV